MRSRIRKRLSFANVVACAALFVALGGVSYAAIAPKNSVRSSSIKNGQVKSVDLASNAVTAAKIRDSAVGASEIAAGAVGAAEVAPALRADLDDAATVEGKSVGTIIAGATEVRQAQGARAFTGTSPASAANTVTLTLPAGTWLLHMHGHATATATAPDSAMSVGYEPFVGATSLGAESVTLNTELSIIVAAVASRAWDRSVLISTSAEKTVTLRTTAVANGGNWTAGGRALEINRASIVAERVGTAVGAIAIP